jgi:N-acetylgalactosamine kinase
MKRSFVTVILAGGKGTRMGSGDKHKVCFEVLDTPVIIRALETYNLCGAVANVVVVGMMAESVMATVNQRFPGTIYAFQEKPLGTGNAARKAAEILERMRFDGDALVIAGDKVMDPRVLRRLLATHGRSRADVTLATAKRPPNSSAGFVIKSARGNIAGIVEEAERRRLLALAEINAAFHEQRELSRGQIARILSRTCIEKHARALAGEIWRGKETARKLRKADFEANFTRDQRAGWLRVGKEIVTAADMLRRFDQMNMSTYLFHAPVLYDALSRLKSVHPNDEEYLTDVFEILAHQKKPARVVGCEIADPHDLMAFNNPQELLAIEEVYRQKLGPATVEETPVIGDTLAPAAQWDKMLTNPSTAACRQFQQWYEGEIPWQGIRKTLGAFMQRYGADRNVAIIRSPGRINLMGRHIDHQGGTVNVMAVNREIILVAAPRNDDVVSLSNTDENQFSEQAFRISDLVANLNWDDWEHVIDGPRIQRMLDAARGDWANYIKAAILRLQDQFRDRRLRGLDMMVSGDIPMGAGLSSSSALVVATAEAVTAFNRLPVSARRLVSLCGEGEWFVGTRGGAADHAAIKLSRRGYVTRVGFFPFRIEDAAKFLPGCDLVVCNSGIYAGKSKGARNVFNARVTAYHIGRVWFKMLRPELAAKIVHLRDINAKHLGLSRAEFAHTLRQLPHRVTRARVQAAFSQMADAERQRIERLFLSHEPPGDGYAVRDVVLFGLSEMERAQKCLELLRRNDAEALGRMMTVSHDGDRVSRESPRHKRKRVSPMAADRAFESWAKSGKRGADLTDLPGAYACSLRELDRIVDLALHVPGVAGAQLAGAGLGGCIMVLVQKSHTANLLAELSGQEIRAEVFRPIAGACSLTMC